MFAAGFLRPSDTSTPIVAFAVAIVTSALESRLDRLCPGCHQVMRRVHPANEDDETKKYACGLCRLWVDTGDRSSDD